MNKEYVLNLDSLTDLNNFVIDISSNIPCDVDAQNMEDKLLMQNLILD